MAIKSLDKLLAAHPEMFHRYSDERDTGDGIWLYCQPGYYCPDMECGTIHEDTVREVLALAKTVEKLSEEDRKIIEG